MEISVPKKINISEIVNQYTDRLTGFIRKRVAKVEDVEDILQEVFYQLAEADRMTKPIDQIASWLFTVARNRITDMYRKNNPELLLDIYSSEEEEPEPSIIGELLADESNTPEIAYLRTLVAEEVENSLKLLPKEQREVFEMTELQGLSFNEISTLTNVPVNTLISRKHYAVLYLRDRLRDLYDELINF